MITPFWVMYAFVVGLAFNQIKIIPVYKISGMGLFLLCILIILLSKKIANMLIDWE